MIPFLITSISSFWISPCLPISYRLRNTLFSHPPIPLLTFYQDFLHHMTPITLISLGTPPSGLVYWAWQFWTTSRNGNNMSFFLPLPPPFLTQRHVSYVTSKHNTMTLSGMPGSGNRSYLLMANPLLFILALSHSKIGALHQPPSSLLLVMPSPQTTLTFFGPTQVILPSAHAARCGT